LTSPTGGVLDAASSGFRGASPEGNDALLVTVANP
jgi:hypothetical protein